MRRTSTGSSGSSLGSRSRTIKSRSTLSSSMLLSALVLSLSCAGGDSNPQPDAGPDGPSADAPPVCDEICAGVYVARNGSDSADGTKAAPVSTITRGIEIAKMASPPRLVVVKAGLYEEQVVMHAGTSVRGGFDDGWRPNDGAKTEIFAPAPAVDFTDITVPTKLIGVTVRSANAQGASGSSMAIVLNASRQIELIDVEVVAGDGSSGVDGGNGIRGADGLMGGPGRPGCEDSSGACSSCSRPAAGTAGGSDCDQVGGRGGRPGHGDSGAEPGDGGEDGIGTFVAGGAGGAGGTGVGRAGAVGVDGSPGLLGVMGAGGVEIGMFIGTTYVISSGIAGQTGFPGGGAGGGGGGGGGDSYCNSYGSSGGGGGGGGCAGTGGGLGTGGGGSFGIVARDSQFLVKSSTVSGGRGGAGGRGGTAGGGGFGGAGGFQGAGPDPDTGQDDGGRGGAGGRGGDGGGGGHGGGGGGGPAAAIVCLGTTTVNIPQTTLVPGTGGAGGGGPLPGAAGLTVPAVNCSFF